VPGVTAPVCPTCAQPATAAFSDAGWECRNEACPEFGQSIRPDEPPPAEPAHPGRAEEETMSEPRNLRFEEGLAVRRDVLGREYVDRSLASADDFTRPMQELVTEYCWGAVWTRPGLDRRTRSLINLGMITALNRPHELELHVRGALNNGCTEEEIREALLQSAIYCGVPAAIDAFRIARSVLADRDGGG
jgi:4-carboxymuconolactone decarboxylase